MKLNDNALMGVGMPTMNGFTSKADALKFAIEFTATFSLDLTRKANTEQAKELYDFICKNVELPEITTPQWDGVIQRVDDIAKMVQEYLGKEIAERGKGCAN
jgi:hypothetical protein